MNFKKYISLVAIAALTLTACDTDKLQIEQQGTLTTDTYLTADDDGVLAFIAAVYAGIRGDSYEAVIMGDQASCYGYWQYYLNRMAAETADEYTYSETADASTYSQIWSYFYQTIMRCTMIIENVPNNTVASADVITQVVAEARAIRAIGMMQLVQLYGTPPLCDHLLEGTEGNTPAEESWAWIEEELTAAAEDLPTKSGLGGQSTIGGRITREAAYAYLGEAQLWQGNYSDAASTLYNKVISTGKYALYDSYTYYNSATLSDFTDENIWEFDFNESTDASTGQEGAFDLVCFSAPVYYWWSTYATLLMAWNMGGCVNADFQEFLATHDGTSSDRYAACILDVCSVTLMGLFNSTPLISDCQGYIRVKDLCLEEDLTGTFPYNYSLRNTAYMRYAEVLLNYAEAVCMGGTAGSGLSGLEALNLVRRRAGLDDAPSLDMDNETYGIKAERRAELYCEGQRFIDLVRWGDAADVLADCGKYSYSTNLTNGFEISGITMYFGFEVYETATGGSGFKSGKNELFPIPQTELNTNTNLVQNTGW